MPNNFHPLLLRALCPEDSDEAIRRYRLLRKKLEDFFRFKGMYDPVTDADDTCNRAEEKLAKGSDIPDITKFCLGIARNIVYEHLRNKKREEWAFLNFLEYSQDKSTEETVAKIKNLMKPCFEQLSTEDQELLIKYCKVPPGVDRAEHRLKLADSLNLSISALRIRVARLRRRLADCMIRLREKQ